MRIIIESEHNGAQPTITTDTASVPSTRATAKNGGAAPTVDVTTSQGPRLASISRAGVVSKGARARDAGSALGGQSASRKSTPRDGGAASRK